ADHKTPGGIDEIRPHAKRDCCFVRGDQLAGGDQFDTIPDIMLSEQFIHDWQSCHNWQADRICKFLISRACPAFTASKNKYLHPIPPPFNTFIPSVSLFSLVETLPGKTKYYRAESCIQSSRNMTCKRKYLCIRGIAL